MAGVPYNDSAPFWNLVDWVLTGITTIVVAILGYLFKTWNKIKEQNELLVTKVYYHSDLLKVQSERIEKLEESEKSTQERLLSMPNRDDFNRVSQSIQDSIENRFNQLDGRFDRLDNRVDSILARGQKTDNTVKPE